MVYDIENLLADIEATLKANLNTVIARIDAEKADSIVLKQIPSSAYFFETLDQRVANFNPFILYGIEGIDTITQRGSSAQKITISVIVVLHDPQDKNPIPKRMLRYSRALKETIEENYTLTSNGISLEIQSLVPVPFQLLNSTLSYRAVGILITATLP